MSEQSRIVSIDEKAVEDLLRETLQATDSQSSCSDRAASLGIRVVADEAARADEILVTSVQGRAPWRQRLIEAERGLAHALRSESTLLGYVVAIAIASLAAGILKVPGLQLVVIGCLAVQAVLVELIRIAIREISGTSHKAAHVAAAASILAAGVALGATAVILGTRLLHAF